MLALSCLDMLFKTSHYWSFICAFEYSHLITSIYITMQRYMMVNSRVTVGMICASHFLGTPPHAASSTKKPRSRGIFHSLFCCLCHDETDHVPVNNNAPLLVEENGTISKVRVYFSFVTFFYNFLF